MECKLLFIITVWICSVRTKFPLTHEQGRSPEFQGRRSHPIYGLLEARTKGGESLKGYYCFFPGVYYVNFVIILERLRVEIKKITTEVPWCSSHPS